ncbi:hypothetical protein GBA52_010143 [Prunus armeniaca]|nr:hypothetical protein GBA52_010143 [Prunus armeniaca]
MKAQHNSTPKSILSWICNNETKEKGERYLKLLLIRRQRNTCNNSSKSNGVVVCSSRASARIGGQS